MSLSAIRKQYGVPAKRGGRICFTNCDGVQFYCTIMKSRGSHLRVRVDEHVNRARGSINLHPTWNVEYLESKGGDQ